MKDQAAQLRAIVGAMAGAPAGGSGRSSDPVALAVTESAQQEGDPGSSGIYPGTSVPRGLVSFGPPPTARHRSVAHRTAGPQRVELARAIAVTSGKGGVGKTNIAVNLAVCMAQLGLKVCLIDGDLGLANADVLCNLTPRLTLEHVVAGQCRLAEIMVLAPGGFRLIPGASGVARMAELGSRQRQELMEQLATIDRVADALIIDTGAGISENVLALASAAHATLVITTPEPTAITDAYGIVKALCGRMSAGSGSAGQDTRIELLINMAASEAEGRSVFGRLDRVSRAFLNRELVYAGTIPTDAAVRDAVRQRLPLALLSPQSAAAKAVMGVAQRLAGTEVAAGASGPERREGFFRRLAGWMGAARHGGGQDRFPGRVGTICPTGR